MSNLKPIFKKMIIDLNAKIINEECELTDEQMMEIMEILSHRPVSKATACDDILHISQSTFNQWLAMGWLPKGRKRKGFKELVWYEDELIESAKTIKCK